MRVKVRDLLQDERLRREGLEVLVQDATKDLASLCEVSQTVNKTSLNLKDLLNEVLQKVMEAIAPAEAAVLFLYQKDKGLVPASCMGYDLASMARVRIAPGEGMTGASSGKHQDQTSCESSSQCRKKSVAVLPVSCTTRRRRP